jgi:hypothetical protein
MGDREIQKKAAEVHRKSGIPKDDRAAVFPGMEAEK